MTLPETLHQRAEPNPVIEARRPRARGRAATVAICCGVLALAAAIVFVAFWPGVLTPDSNQTVWQAENHFSLDWWTGAGGLALRAWYWLGLGLPLVFVAAVGLWILGAFYCVRVALRPIPAALATAFIVVFPPDFGQLSGVSRENFSMGFSFLAFAALGTIIRGQGQHRRALITGALLSAILAYLCRQNSVSVLFAVVVFAVLYDQPRSGRRIAVGVLAAVAVSVAVYVGFEAVYPSIGVRRVHPERMMYVDDLAAISTATHHDYFPVSLQRRWPVGGATPENVTEPVLEREYRWQNMNSLYPDNQEGKIDFGNADLAAWETVVLRRAWLSAITAHPSDYLWNRTRLLAAELGIVGVSISEDAYDAAIDTDNFGHPIAFTRAYRTAGSVLRFFVDSGASIPLDIPWTYLIALALLLGYLWRGPVTERLLPATMVVALGADIALLFFAPIASWRYVNMLAPVTLLLIIYAGRQLALSRQRAPDWLEVARCPSAASDVDDVARAVEVVTHIRPRRPKRHLKNIRKDGKNSLRKLIFLPSSKPRAT